MDMHTPGPWVKDRFGALRGSNGQQVLIADSGIGFASGHERPELHANTALIWAAPELLDSLIVAREWLRGDKWRDSTVEKHASWEALMRGIDKTIAKATGGAK